MTGIDVIVVGGGGREYELARQMAGSKKIRKVFVAPGNAGTALLEKCENIPFKALDFDDIVAFIKKQKFSAVIIGPEQPLVAGLADLLRAAGAAVFGPSKTAAQLEGSKSFTASFMQRHDIPQPNFWNAHSEKEALDIIKNKSPDSYVLKADGLASGKGVVLPKTREEAKRTLAAMFSGKEFEGAGKETVVIQERLHGPEVSAFAVTDGTNFVLLPFAQDHKRLMDYDEGPNTGGMGAYAPLPEAIVSQVQAGKIRDIAARTIKGMKNDGTPYQGVLFIGLMLAEERGGDPTVIEYNVRFGDPEAEVILPVLSESGVDVAAMLLAAAQGDIAALSLPQKMKITALSVCLSASGYPESPRKGDEILGLDKTYGGIIIHHAGTKRDGDKIITAGGRVLYVTGLGATPDEAAARAYAAIGEQGIHFDGMHYRRDIGHQIRMNSIQK